MCVLRAITSTKYSWVSCYRAQQSLIVLPHNKKEVVYCIPCQDCDKVYIGEMGRTLHACQKEHKRHLTIRHTEDSAVAAHAHRQNSRHRLGEHLSSGLWWWLFQEESKGGTTNETDNFNQDSGWQSAQYGHHFCKNSYFKHSNIISFLIIIPCAICIV